MDQTPTISRFDDFYKNQIPPWVIGEPQPAVVDQGVAARFEVVDALDLQDSPGYDTIIDSALFHIFADGDRAKYVRSLHVAARSGAIVHVLALSDAGRGFGPEVSEKTIRDAFGAGWELEELTTTTYRGLVTDVHAEALGLAVGTHVDEPAWLARVRRI